LANVLNLIPGSSKHIRLLSNELGFLEDLNSYYRDFAVKNSDLKTVVYYEKFKTKNLLEIVDRSSADPGVAGSQPVPVDKDHINICKPKDQDDVVYIGVKRHVKKIYDTTTLNITEQDDYTIKSTSDRRDLLTKLIDANREQEYSVANEYQNSFARKILRFGLYTKARDDHDSLLTEIESRFNLHIYHPLICKEATDVQISSAIQTLIIDPLIQKNIGGTLFNSKDVLSALYYLTEQCHLRWDPTSKC
jgi:protein SERAC1